MLAARLSNSAAPLAASQCAIALEKEAQEKLTSEGWVDKAKGLVHVSIIDAIPLAVAELRSKKPAPSQIKVEPPLMPVIMPDPNSKEPAPLPPALFLRKAPMTMRFVPLPTPQSPQPAPRQRLRPPRDGPGGRTTRPCTPAQPAPAPAPHQRFPRPPQHR